VGLAGIDPPHALDATDGIPNRQMAGKSKRILSKSLTFRETSAQLPGALLDLAAT